MTCADWLAACLAAAPPLTPARAAILRPVLIPQTRTAPACETRTVPDHGKEEPSEP